MSNPSYSNIDRWLFELMEGNLSSEQVAQLEAFLIQHPELDVDRDMWELAKVDSGKEIYPYQKKLERRRPVGLYMAMGFTSIILISSLAVFNEVSSPLDDIQLAENNSDNKGIIETRLFKSSRNTAKNFSVKDNEVNTEKVNSTSLEMNNFDNGSFEQTSSYSTQGFSPFHVYSTPIQTQNSIVNHNTVIRPIDNPINNNPEINKEEVLLAQNTIEEAEVLETKKAEPIEYQREEKYANTFKPTLKFTGERFEKSDYNISFSSKLNKFGRNVQRMMDNPVALKNMKDPYYHVPGMQAMDVNFGAVGTLLATRVQSVSRAQWYGAENQQFMNQVSVDGYSYGMRGGLGFQLNQNYYGKGGIQNYHASLTYSPKFSVSRNVVFEPSVRFKMGNKTLNDNQIQSGSQVEYERMNMQDFYTNGTSPIGQNLWYKDLGVGLMVNTKWFFVGIQGDNLFNHYDNIYSNDLSNPRRAGEHYVGTIGFDYQSKKDHISKKENLTISPYLVFQHQEKLSEAWAGINFRYEWLTIGGAISTKLEPAASIGVKFKYFMFSYNADYVKSSLLNNSRLSHQLTIRFLSKPSRIGQRLLNQ